MEIRNLNAEEISALSDGLNMAGRMLNYEGSIPANKVQELYDYFLNNGREFEEGVIALGLAFGALFIDGGGYEWARVSDEYGDETVVRINGKKLFCSPISMIQKRLDRREAINIQELYQDTVEALWDNHYHSDDFDG